MRIRFLFPLTLVCLLGGCSILLFNGDARDLDDARERWEDQGWDDYRFTFNWNCFCTPDYTRQAELTVRDGDVVSATFVDSSLAIPTDELDRYRTIDGLFDLIEDAHDRGAHKIEADYHPELGYPTQVWIDYEEFTADEEMGFRVTDVQDQR